MEQREMEVIVIAANDLKDVSRLGRLRPYAEVWVDPSAKQRTPFHTENPRNPKWNHSLFFTVPEASFRHPSAVISIQVLHQCRIHGRAAVVGSASLPLHQFLTAPDMPFSCDVRDSSGCSNGSIKLCVHLGSKYVPQIQGTLSPVMAYPAFPEAVGNGPPNLHRYPNSRRRLPRGQPALPYLLSEDVKLPFLE